MRIFLNGFMASGKTSVGEQLAGLLEVEFVDLDERIERQLGMSVAEIFADHGEERFRDLETQQLRRLADRPGVVVALGGGALLRPENRELLRGRATVVWLDTDRSTIRSRLSRSGSSRPLGRDPQAAMRLFEQRLPTYRDADLRVRPRDGETALGVARRIARLLEE